MLDAFIIEAIRREELERELARDNRIHLEIPQIPLRRPEEEEEEIRGPIVIPLYPEDAEDAEDTAA